MTIRNMILRRMSRMMETSSACSQMSLFTLMKSDKHIKGYEREWLEANGYKNIYHDKPPKPGIYEWRDINQMGRAYQLEYKSNGAIHMGSLGDFRAIWWRPLAAGDAK